MADDSVVRVTGSVVIRERTAIVDVVAAFREGYGEPITDSAAVVIAIGDSLIITFAPVGYRLAARCREPDPLEGRFSAPLSPGAAVAGRLSMVRRP